MHTIAKKVRVMFFPEKAHTEEQMRTSRRILLIQGAMASVMLSLTTGNFMAGYLAYLGASPSMVARIAIIPQLGCVLQMISPFFFERLKYRKLPIALICFAFRFSIGFAVFAPVLFQDQKTGRQFVFVLYFFAFLAAGFVTPALNQWMLQVGPVDGRGRYFAIKDILAMTATSGVSFLMGYQLDFFIGQEQAWAGYLVVYAFCILFSIVDFILMLLIREPENSVTKGYSLKDVAGPFRNPHYRPVLIYNMCSYFATLFASGFLAIYQLKVLHLNHTFIVGSGVLASILGVGGIWLWGKVADRTFWTMVVLGMQMVTGFCNLGWFFMKQDVRWAALVLICVSALGNASSGMAGLNLQYASAPPERMTTYLGVTAAAASMVGYAGAMAAAALQEQLERIYGSGQSIAVLFLISGVTGLFTACYGLYRLPQKRVDYLKLKK